jgi:hypothetical protein
MKKLVFFCLFVALGVFAILAVFLEDLIDAQQSMAREREMGPL